MTIVLNVNYLADDDNAVQFVKEIKSSGLLEKIRKEPGNLKYEYFTSTDNPNNMFLVEHWDNAYDLSRHSQSANMKKLAQLKEKYNVTSQVQKFIVD